jgi:hypothetical protein
MPGRDGTGPWGHGPLTGGRRGSCAGGGGYPGGGGRGWRNRFHATGLSAWQRGQLADAPATEQIGDASYPLAGLASKLSEVVERLERLEATERK